MAQISPGASTSMTEGFLVQSRLIFELPLAVQPRSMTTAQQRLQCSKRVFLEYHRLRRGGCVTSLIPRCVLSTPAEAWRLRERRIPGADSRWVGSLASNDPSERGCDWIVLRVSRRSGQLSDERPDIERKITPRGASGSVPKFTPSITHIFTCTII